MRTKVVLVCCLLVFLIGAAVTITYFGIGFDNSGNSVREAEIGTRIGTNNVVDTGVPIAGAQAIDVQSFAVSWFFMSDGFYGLPEWFPWYNEFMWVFTICQNYNLYAQTALPIDLALAFLGEGAPQETIDMFRNDYGLPEYARIIREHVMSDVLAVVTNGDANFVIRSDNSLWGWGRNASRQLGLGIEHDDVLHPHFVMDNIANVTIGGRFNTYALTVCGNLYGWGGSLFYYGIAERNLTPAHVMDNVLSVHAGTMHSFAIRADGSLWAWSWNDNGQLGVGTTEFVPITSPVRVMEDVVYVTTVAPTRSIFALVGYLNSSFAITSDGGLWAWGRNGGRFGIDETADLLSPVRIMDGVLSVYSVLHPTTRSVSTFVIKNDSSLWHFGENSIYTYWGEYSDGSAPVLVMENVNSVWVDNLGFNPVVLDNNGVVWQSPLIRQDWNHPMRATFERFEPTDLESFIYLRSDFMLMADGSLWRWENNILPPGSVRVPPMADVSINR